MKAILYYLLSLGAHIVSFFLGRRGSLSSIPLGKKRAIPVKPLSGWHVLIAVWLLQKVWNKYGNRVTDKARQQAARYDGPFSDVLHRAAKTTADSGKDTITVEPIYSDAQSK